MVAATFGGENTYVMTTVAVSGDEPPGRPGEVFTTFTDPSINNTGLVTFKGNFDGPASGNEGVYLFGGNSLSRAVDDSFDFHPPSQSGASSWTSFGPAVINGSGHILFRGNFSFGDNSQGLYVFTGSNVELIFDDNPLQSVPGQPDAIGFTVFPYSAGFFQLVSDNDFGMTIATFRDALFAEHNGVYLGRPGEDLIRLADDSVQPPGQPGSARFSAFNPFMVMSIAGDGAFVADYTGGVGSSGLYQYIREDEDLFRIADGQLPPPSQVATSRFSQIDQFPTMNGVGRIAFLAGYSGGSGNRGIFSGRGDDPLEVVVDNSGGFEVPGDPAADFFDFSAPVMNEAGDVVFGAQIGFGADDAGLYIERGGSIQKIVDFSDPVPGQPGASFIATGSYIVNGLGHVTFTGRYSGGIGDEGIYFWDGQGLRRVIDESSNELGVTATNFHMMLGIGGSGGQDGKAKSLNDTDQIVFRAALSGGGEGIFLASSTVTSDDSLAVVTVPIPNNDSDTNGDGAVNAVFRIGLYEVTNDQ